MTGYMTKTEKIKYIFKELIIRQKNKSETFNCDFVIKELDSNYIRK